MKSELSSLDLHFIVKELKVLVDSKINRVFQHGRKEFTFELHVTGKGRHFLRVDLPKFIYLSSSKGKTLPSPPGFCMFLRKHLNNARIRNIEQLGSERILQLKVETKEGILYIILELFGRGNLIVCDKDFKIISLIESQKGRERTVLPGASYEPPAQRFDFFHPDEKSIKSLLKEDEDILVKRIAKKLSVGGVLAEELCLRAGIDKKEKDFNVKKARKVLKAVKDLGSSKPSPQTIFKDGAVKDILPISLSFYGSYDNKPAASFSQALDETLSAKAKLSAESISRSKYDKQIEKQQVIIDRQRKQIASLDKAVEENRRKAEIIYEKYPLVDSIIKDLQKASKTHPWAEIKKKLKGHKLVKEVDPKTKTIIIDI